MPLAPPPSSAAPKPPIVAPPEKPKDTSWAHLSRTATSMARVISLLIFILALGSVVGFFIGQTKKKPAELPKVAVQTLSDDEIRKLTEVGSSLGTSGQVLNIGANALFRGKVDVASNLSIGGTLNANGPVVLSQLNITGTSALAGLNVGSNLNVAGQTNMQKSLTVQDLVAVNGGLNVSGTASINSVNANSISVRNISISGPLTVGHLSTQGVVPVYAGGTAVGAGGTVSMSGNDTAGTININTGSSTVAGVLISVTFRAAYGGQVHVLLSPVSGPAASLPTYVTRTNAGFLVRTDAAPAAGQVFSFDYFVTQ